MTRLMNTLVLAGTLLPVVLAFNEIFGFSPSDPTCTACLDEVFESCPGDYKTRSYATCMCGGVGSTNFVGCTSNSCDPSVNSPNNAARMWYNYCTQFFPAELCPDAEQYMNADIFQDQCSSEAIASGGLGSDEPSETGSTASLTVSSTSSSGASSPTGGSGTGGGGSSSKTTSSSGYDSVSLLPNLFLQALELSNDPTGPLRGVPPLPRPARALQLVPGRAPVQPPVRAAGPPDRQVRMLR